MALSKQFLNRVRKVAEEQGAVVTQGRGQGGLRIKAPNGRVLIVHSTPSRPEVYKLSLADNFRKIGLIPPVKGWK